MTQQEFHAIDKRMATKDDIKLVLSAIDDLSGQIADVKQSLEFAVDRHLRTRNPCIDGAYLPKKLKIHRYMYRRIELDIEPMALYLRRHVPTNEPTATQTRF
jgi:hypothetical protein